MNSKRRFHPFCVELPTYIMIILAMLLFQMIQPHAPGYKGTVFSFGPISAAAAQPVAEAGKDQTVVKDLPLAGTILLDGSGSNDPDADPLAYLWYGPFETTHGIAPTVVFPEGSYTVSLIVNDGSALSGINTTHIVISPCFTIEARAKIGEVQLTWTHLESSQRYIVYRADESNPFDFEIIAETTSTYSGYLDTTISNEKSYLYLVKAVSECTGDLDNDGDVDGADLLVFYSDVGRTDCDQGEPCEGDFNGAGNIDFADISLFSNNFGNHHCTPCCSNVAASHPTALRAIANYAPVIYSKPVKIATTGIIYNYDVNAADPNSNTLSYSLISFPDGMTISPVTGLITWTPETTGSYDVSVNVSDGKGGTAVQNYSITVSEIPALNQPPHITSSPILNATEGIIYAYPVTAEDPDQDTLVFSLLEGPAGSIIDADTGLLKWPSPVAGSFPVTLKVSDGQGGTDTQTYMLSVKDILNRPPVFTSTPVVDAYVNVPYAYDADATDPDQDTLTFSLETGPEGLSVDTSSGITGWTPTAGQAGEHQIILKVNDGKNGVAVQSYTVFVHHEPGNTIPTIISEPVTNFTPCILYTYDVDALDADGDELTYSLLDSPPGMSIDPKSGIISATTVELPIPELNFVAHHINDGGNAAKTDSDGNTYITGSFSGTVDFDPGPGTYNLTSKGGQDIVVKKLDNHGNLIWVFSFGSTAVYEYGRGIAIDPWGDIVVTGYFEKTVDFDPSDNISNLTSQGGQDLFVLKLNTQGEFRWARSAGSANNDLSVALATDSEGNVISTGLFYDTVDFDPGPDEHKLSSNGSYETFVWKLDKEGNFVWAHSSGGPQGDHGYDITTDRLDNVYVIGNFKNSVDFDPGPGVYQLTADLSGNAFVWKLDKDGDFVWAGQIGGPGIDQGQGGIAVDKNYNVYVTGEITGPADLDPGPGIYNSTGFGGYDIFVCKLDINGNLIWGHVAGSQYQDIGYGIAVDCSGSVYVTGTNGGGSIDFDPGPGQDVLNSFGGYDGFLWKLDKDGNHQWARRFGNTGQDGGYDVDISNVGLLTVSGIISGPTDLDLTDGIFNTGPTNAQWGFTAVYNTIEFDPDVTVQVSDGRGGVDTQKFALILEKASNSPPKIISKPIVNAVSNQSYTYNVQADDPDSGDVLTYSIVTSPSGMDIDKDSGIIQWMPAISNIGNNSVKVRVSDQGGLFDEQSFVVTVAAPPLPNHPPVITSFPGLFATVGQPYRYQVLAADPDDGDTITYELTASPVGMSIDSLGGLVRFTPTSDQIGTHGVIIRAIDQGGLSATQSYVVIVSDTVIENRAPIAKAGLLNDPSLPACVTPPGGLTSWYTGDSGFNDVVGISSPTQIIRAPQLVPGKVGQAIKFDGQSGLVVPNNPTIDFDENESFTIDAWVRVDGGSGSYADNAVIDRRDRTIARGYAIRAWLPPVTPPGTVKFCFSIDEDTRGTANERAITRPVPLGEFHLIGGVVDRVKQSISIYLDGILEQEMKIDHVGSLSSDARLFIGHHTLDAGTYVTPLIGQIDELEIFSRALSQKEIQTLYLSGNAGKCKLQKGDTVILDGSGSSDADGDPLLYKWTLLAKPDGSTAVLDNPAAVQPVFVADQAGVYRVQLVVSDGQFDSPPSEITLQLSDGNLPPIAMNDHYSVRLGDTLNLPAPGVIGNDYDPNGTPLSAVKISDPSNGSLTFNADGALSYIPDVDVFGPGTTAHTLIGTTYMPGQPKDIAIDVRANRIYITNLFVQTLAVIDGTNGKIIKELHSNSQIEDVAFNPVTNRIYVTCPKINQSTTSTIAYFNGVYVYDGTTFALITTIPIGGSQVEDIVINPVTNRIYVASLDNDSVSVIDGQANAVIATIPVGTKPRQLAVDKKTDKIFALSATDKTVTLIDGLANTTLATLAMGNDPRFLLVDEDHGRLFVTNFNSAGVSVIDQASRTVIKNISVGTAPLGMALDPDSQRLYVANSGSNSVSVIDCKTLSMLNTISVGVGPESITINPLNKTVYVSNTGNDTVSVIDAVSGTVSATVSVGHKPAMIAVNPVTDRVYTADTGSHTVSVVHVGDHFTYKVNDGEVDSNIATATIAIEPQNSAPVALEDYYQAAIDISLTIPAPGLLRNDLTLNGKVLNAELVSEPAKGSLALNADGSFSYIPESGFRGTTSFTYRAKDDIQNSNVAEVFITVGAFDNIDPVITSIPIDRAFVDSPYIYSIQATDSDNDFLTYILAAAPDGMVIEAATGVINWTPAIGQLGNHTIEAQVSDDKGGIATQSFNIQVAEAVIVNSPPSITSTPILTAKSNTLYWYNAAALDPDEDQLIFDLPGAKPAGMSIDSSRGIVLWTPSSDQVGHHNILLRVSDGKGGVDLQSFQIQVTSGNTPPIITSIPIEAAMVSVLYQYAVQAQDAEGDPLTYELYDIATEGMTIDESTGLISWVPVLADYDQTYSINVRVNDGMGGQGIQKFNITVLEPTANQPPRITSTPPQKVQLGYTYLYQVEALDDNSDALHYSLDAAPSGMTISASGLVQWTPSADQLGLNTVAARVDDGRGLSVIQNFSIEVVTHLTNAAPNITSTPVNVAVVGQIYVYDAKAMDADNDLFFWQLDSSPPGMSISTRTGAVRWIPGMEQTGLNDVVIRVIDSQGGWATQSFNINVRSVNTPPNIISTPPVNAYIGYPYTYAVKATDIEQDTLTYLLLKKPLGMSIDPATGEINWTPMAEQIGGQIVEIRVEDGKGGYALQSFTVQATNDKLNNPPNITSVPQGTATSGVRYEYAVMADDPEGDPLMYLLDISPGGMSMDTKTGLIQWTSTIAQIGSHSVTVIVKDTYDNIAFQSYSISVVNSNKSPVITSTPQGPAVAKLAWIYDVIASDPDGEPPAIALIKSPAGMTLDGAGHISWMPGINDVGSHSIEITATDKLGASVTQSFTLPVIIDSQVPNIGLSVNQNPIPRGSQLVIKAWATDNVGVASLVVTLAGTPVNLDGNGQASLMMDTFGDFELVVTATDTSGNSNNKNLIVRVYDPSGDQTPPVVEISSPQNGDTVSNISNVIGTVSDDNLLYYALEVALADDEQYTEIFRHTSPVTGGTLGSFDPTILANDTYLLRLTALDAAGNSSQTTIRVNVDGALKIGNFTLSFTDLSIPVSGIPVTVSRTYDTLKSKQKSDLGYGWRLEIKDTDLRTSVPKTGQEEQRQFNAFTHGDRVYITTPDGRRQGFTFTPEPPRNVGESFLGTWHPAFTPDSGVTSQLKVEDIYLQYVPSADKFVFYAGSNYNPSDTAYTNGLYLLKTSDGLTYAIDALSGDLRTLSDTNNNSLTFTDTAVISSAGPRINFTRDSSGRITSLVAPDGNRVIYGYDAKGDLVSVTDREGNVTKFVYSSNPAHYLNEIIDPLGRTGIRNEYDSQGRLVKMFDVNGKAVELIHNPENSIETVVDVLGNQTLYIYDSRGNVITESDSLGGVKERTYDNNNFLLTETDALGNTTTYTRDGKGNPLTITDPLGNTTYNTYGPFGLLLTTTDPLGNTTTNTYDSRGNLISTTDAAGNKTTFTCDGSGNQTSVKDAMGKTTAYQYDSAGNQISQTDPMGHITRYSYDGNGNQVSRTDPLGNITSNIYNANGQLISTTDALGNTSLTEYNALGKNSATIDPLGNRTGFIYDAKGQLIRTIYPDGAVEESNYDAAGRRISSTDSLGNITTYEYDALGRTVKTVLPDGAFTRTEYDAAGRSIAQIDALGNRIEFEYDAAGRKTLTRDALGNETTTGYDAAGRMVSQTNTLGNTTDFDYDVLGRQTQVTYADGSTTQKTYDALGRPVTQTDQAGNLTHFEYDVLGKLTAVIDALGQRTEYGYDIKGNMITQKDANGHITRFEYDAEGRRTATILPLGQRSDAVYDAAGNLISAVDFNGDAITFEYNSRKQLISKRFPDGTATMFTYTASGQQETITDERGQTSFFYDSRNRLVYRVDPDGTEIHYAYDAVGNRTSVTGKSSTVEYTFDALNRLKTVADLDGGITAYTYDGIGNLIQTDLPNGTAEIRSHDALNRLVRLENRSSVGLISSYQYTLDATGNRTAVAEATGRRVEYLYDNLRRLERETITDPATGNRTIIYSFDPVGNRLTRNDSAEGITTYVYDANDRLLTETLNSRTTAYAYDDNGNTLSRNAGPTDTADFSWNFENRLVAADVMDTSGTKQLKYHYDAEGIRVSTKVNGIETRYLIDTSHPYQQVFEEYTPENNVLASYVHGHDLISQERGSERSFHHVDGLGSTRELSDATGQVTDQYLYDAYGRTISKSGSTANAYLFAGEQRDFNLGLDYLRARYMNYNAGRFFGTDPFMGNNLRPMSLNKYIYATASPVIHTDPSGQFLLWDLITSTLIRSALLKPYQANYGLRYRDRYNILAPFLNKNINSGVRTLGKEFMIKQDLGITWNSSIMLGATASNFSIKENWPGGKNGTLTFIGVDVDFLALFPATHIKSPGTIITTQWERFETTVPFLLEYFQGWGHILSTGCTVGLGWSSYDINFYCGLLPDQTLPGYGRNYGYSLDCSVSYGYWSVRVDP